MSVLRVSLDYVSHYKYLGLVLHEHLDFNVTAKCVAQSTSRALGLVIAKAKAFGGFPFGTFSKLYDATVSSVISYGASTWGTRDYLCVSAVQHVPADSFWGLENLHQMLQSKEIWVGCHRKQGNGTVF